MPAQSTHCHARPGLPYGKTLPFPTMAASIQTLTVNTDERSTGHCIQTYGRCTNVYTSHVVGVDISQVFGGRTLYTYTYIYMYATLNQ